jgi:hypothetical protein
MKNSAVAVNFEIVSRYLGWRDPNNHGLWFVGIEEGSYTYESVEDIRMPIARCAVVLECLLFNPLAGHQSEPLVFQ